MKLKYRDIAKDGSGSVGLIPEEPEDMWHAFNLISQGDRVKSTTVRRVQSESATGSSSSERVRITLAIEVENILFDAPSGKLRLTGKNVTENKYVKLGAYHTLDLEENKEFTIQKANWDSIALQAVQNAVDPTTYADVGAIVMSEGLAHVCVVTATMTIVRARIEASIPRKRKGSVTGHDKGLEKFFESVLQAMLRHLNFEVVKCIILASPGFVKEQFFDYIMQEAMRQDIKMILENKQKFLLVHASSGHKHALKEVLADPQVSSKLLNTKAAGEVKALNDFYDMLKNDPDRAFYGVSHVELANERMAIQTLLISDELFRSADIKTRQRYVKLVESAKELGAEVKIFSSMHVSGEQLGQLSGIAAILRFPLPEIEDAVSNEDDKDENSDSDSDGIKKNGNNSKEEIHSDSE